MSFWVLCVCQWDGMDILAELAIGLSYVWAVIFSVHSSSPVSDCDAKTEPRLQRITLYDFLEQCSVEVFTDLHDLSRFLRKYEEPGIPA